METSLIQVKFYLLRKRHCLLPAPDNQRSQDLFCTKNIQQAVMAIQREHDAVVSSAIDVFDAYKIIRSHCFRTTEQTVFRGIGYYSIVTVKTGMMRQGQ